MISKFSFSKTPDLHFGGGKLSTLPALIKSYGTKALFVTGGKSFRSSTYWEQLSDELSSNQFSVEVVTVDKEPSPSTIDHAVKKFASFPPDVVIAIGGGSVLDAGKAISAMLLLEQPVKNYLEGVGTKEHSGTKIPFIAIPTTSGTGSEATKNAVLSEAGDNGYKRSLRHNNFVPDIAIVDPVLTMSCPPSITASSGMDAFTQLLESYLSNKANSLTDVLSYEGLKHISTCLLQAYHNGKNLEARTGMAMASYLSGITLANAGLGLVHGFASSIGGFFEIPHGIICSSLMGPANKLTLRKLQTIGDLRAINKYASIGKMFAGSENQSDEYYATLLISEIERWANEMKIPTLSACGVSKSDLTKIVSTSDNKNNPVSLDKEEMMEVLELAL